MSATVLFLDLTHGTLGARDSLDGCRTLDDRDWRLHAVFADAEGESAARCLADLDSRVSAVSGGSGAGNANWRSVVERAPSEALGFLRPADRHEASALTVLRNALHSRPDAAWALGTWTGSPYADWWMQEDLSESAAALLLAGAPFPGAAALVSRRAWLEAAALRPEAAGDPALSGAWLALAVHASPVLTRGIVCRAPSRPNRVGPDVAAAVVAGMAHSDPQALGRLVADLGRITAGMRMAHEALLGQTAFVKRWMVDRLGVSDRHPDSLALVTTLFERRERPIWIWGTGSGGRRALAWLQALKVTVAGFLDSNAVRDGELLEGLTVRHAPRMLGSLSPDVARRPLVLIASMYVEEIAAVLDRFGLRHGEDFMQVPLGNPAAAGGTPA